MRRAFPERSLALLVTLGVEIPVALIITGGSQAQGPTNSWWRIRFEWDFSGMLISFNKIVYLYTYTWIFRRLYFLPLAVWAVFSARAWEIRLESRFPPFGDIAMFDQIYHNNILDMLYMQLPPCWTLIKALQAFLVIQSAAQSLWWPGLANKTHEIAFKRFSCSQISQ